mmetsp:Transcript_46911/g.150801  ORF Transcript_46911/g.150801 Transcript_46911/m.150801 type:complete len:322 (+) Transcript_46911:243-1208(+)
MAAVAQTPPVRPGDEPTQGRCANVSPSSTLKGLGLRQHQHQRIAVGGDELAAPSDFRAATGEGIHPIAFPVAREVLGGVPPSAIASERHTRGHGVGHLARPRRGAQAVRVDPDLLALAAALERERVRRGMNHLCFHEANVGFLPDGVQGLDELILPRGGVPAVLPKGTPVHRVPLLCAPHHGGDAVAEKYPSERVLDARLVAAARFGHGRVVLVVHEVHEAIDSDIGSFSLLRHCLTQFPEIPHRDRGGRLAGVAAVAWGRHVERREVLHACQDLEAAIIARRVLLERCMERNVGRRDFTMNLHRIRCLLQLRQECPRHVR